jgi:glutamate-1-semialdehyde aminotransferase
VENVLPTGKTNTGRINRKRTGSILKEAYGSIVVDIYDKAYIEFTCGWNVMNLGWQRKEIAKAIWHNLESIHICRYGLPRNLP